MMILIRHRHCHISLNLARAVNRLGACKKAQKRAGPLVQPFLEALQVVEQALGILGSRTTGNRNRIQGEIFE